MTHAATPHRLVRHAEAPWIEMRVSTDSAACYRTHTHREYSVGIVDAGEAVFHHPSGPHRVGPGCAVAIEPEVPHACNCHRGRVWTYRMLYIKADWAHAALARHWALPQLPDALHFKQRLLRDPDWVGQLDRLCALLQSDALPADLERQVTVWLAQQIRLGTSPDLPGVPSTLRPAFEAMTHDGAEPPTVQSMARACGMHPSTFVRQFKRVLGMTPGHYLQNWRINGARRLIADGLPLAEAAHATGFADQAHLQRAFKAHHAMTPGRYANASSR
ncbi:MAG TPA: AraC family transcriptional regulator [Hydrogenophaga sp.]